MVAFVQAVNAQGSSVAAIVTAGITTTAGNILVAVGGSSGGFLNGATPFQDSKANTWVLGPNSVTASNVQCHIAVCQIATGGSAHTVTYTQATSGFPSIVVFEISGAATSSVGDTNAVGQATSTASALTLATGSMATTNAADILVCGGVCGGTGAGATQSFAALVGGGTYTVPTNGANNSTALTPISAGYQIVAATATYSATFTSGEGAVDKLGAVIASFKSATILDPWPLLIPGPTYVRFMLN